MATIRQKITAKKLSEIISKNTVNGKVSLGKILKEAGYADSTAKKPKLVTESKGFKELIQKRFTDDEVTARQAELVNSSKLATMRFDADMEDKVIKKMFKKVPGVKLLYIKEVIAKKKKDNTKLVYFLEPIRPIRLNSLDLLYKLRGDFAPIKIEKVDPFATLTDEELEQELAKVEAEKRKRNK